MIMNVCTDDNLVIGDKAFVSVKSFAVITYENTNTDVFAEAMEKTFINEMNRTLNTWHLNFLRQKSVEKESEISYLIFNVNLHVLINFAKTNNLKSFFYCYLGENGIEYEYYMKNVHQDDFKLVDDTQSVSVAVDADVVTFVGKNFECIADITSMKEFDCQLNKMFDVGINKTYVLHLIINCKGYVAAQYRQKFFLTKVKLEDDEVSVVKSGEIEKDVKDFIKWYSNVYDVKMRFRYFKNHYAYAVYEEDEILMYIDRQGNLFNRINMTKPFGTIYHAYKAFYHFRLKDNN